jgi:4-amino-4-deoxy-L-arabinose transferase-like glycosyltransferase
LLRLAAAASRRRSLLALSAVALALGSAALVEHTRHRAGASGPPVITWVLFAVAGASLALAAGDPRRLSVAAVAPLRSVLQTRRRLALVAFAIAGLASAASVPLFLRLNRFDPPRHPGWLINDGSWLLYVSSLIAFAIGIAAWGRSVRLTPTPAVGGEQLTPRLELPLVGGLVAVALALRLIHLDSIPPGLWFDEAQNGLSAQALYASGAPHVVFIPGLTQMGAPFFYVLGGLLQLTGPEVWALRLLPALAGTATVPLLYYLASRLYGWRVGAVAAALLAALAWNITFSRLGYASMWTVALDLAVYLCVVQGLRTGRLGWYAAGGVTLGLALQGYYIAELLPLVLLAIVVHLAITERRTLRALRTGAAVFIAGAALAYLPAGLYAVQRPGDYEQRVGETTIFATTPGDKLDAVLTNARIHLLMFDFRGEDNRRQDLAGSPVLDWITAGLFFSGLGFCLLRLGRWQFFFPIVWWLGALSAGIWASVAGAPHSGRTLENSIVTSLLAGIFLGEAWRVGARSESRRRLVLAGALVGVLAIVGTAAALNVHRYFELQAKDRRTWVDMYAGHVFAGRALERYAATREVWVSDLFYGPYGYSTIAYLAPHGRGRRWTGMERFPFTGGSGRDVVLALDPGAATDLATFAHAYPHARFRALVSTGSDREPVAYTVFVPQRDLRASHEVALVGGRGRNRLVTSLELPRYGRYRLTWQARRGPAPAVYVDGRRAGPQKALPLAAGLHRVVVAPASSGHLTWARPGHPPSPVPTELLFDPRRVPVRGLLGVYRTALGFSPPAERVDRDITFDDRVDYLDLPHTVEWRGRVFAPVSGRYRFETLEAGAARLDLDGKRVFATRPSQPGGAWIHLHSGWHDIRLRYAASTGLVTIRLMWAPPGLPVTVIPSAFLSPPGAAGPPSASPTISAADGTRLPPGRLERTSDLTRAP